MARDLDTSLGGEIAGLERKVTTRALARARGSKARAAALLRITRWELERRIVQYKVDVFGR
jgi:DNA-binding NtrC family response regulator